MKNYQIWFVISIALVVAVIFLYPTFTQEPALQEATIEPIVTGDPNNIVNKEIEPLPKIRYPIPAVTSNEPTEENNASQSKELAQNEKEKIQPLPALEKSDSLIFKILGSLFESSSVKALFRDANIIPRIVVTVDNLLRNSLSPEQMPIMPVSGHFKVEGKDGAKTLSKKNYSRYDIYIKMLENVDKEALIKAYIYMYPLFQQSYEDLGYQHVYFNDRLVDVIDDLLMSPEINGKVKLTRKSVMFKFEDPRLEALSMGQKSMIRMGPENTKRVKLVLKSIRNSLMM